MNRFGLVLRDPKYKGNASYTHALELVSSLTSPDVHGYRKELAELIQKARELAVVK